MHLQIWFLSIFPSFFLCRSTTTSLNKHSGTTENCTAVLNIVPYPHSVNFASNCTDDTNIFSSFLTRWEHFMSKILVSPLSLLHTLKLSEFSIFPVAPHLFAPARLQLGFISWQDLNLIRSGKSLPRGQT